MDLIEFQARYLPALHLFHVRENTRYYLQGVHVCPHEEKGAILVATDGHRLLAIHDASAVCLAPVTVTISKEALKHCKKGGGTAKCRIDLQQKQLKIVSGTPLTDTYIQPGNCVLAGNYPAWRRVLPDFEKLQPGFIGTVNYCYIKDALRLPEAISCSKFRYGDGARFWHTGSGSGPLAVQYDGLPEMMAVLMPMQGKNLEEARADISKHFTHTPGARDGNR